jgi:Flp pilus assembly secretin CpaC
MTSHFAATIRAAAAFGVVSAALLAGAAQAESALDVSVDRATIMRAPAGTATVIIGNPLIADATTQRNGVLVVTGKSFGSTNIMLLDGSGAVLSETLVRVGRASEGMIVVQRGGSRESYSCTPRCEASLSIGDSKTTFKDTAEQIAAHGKMSSGQPLE